ncbi:MAG: hypothetical protein PHX61_00740 [Alphaproteobacteria bacterium]|nr:hypothetical protein [Alphaproteobacteria bacterium]
MNGKKDLRGQRFGRLVVVSESPKRTKSRGVYWLCQCDCGKVKEIASQSLIRGFTTSCGCYNKEVNIKKNTKHGGYGTPTYKSWDKMMQRCTNPNCPEYVWYGKRGITVCEEWKDFAKFRLDMGERSPKTTIDRINVNLGYFKENCRWANANIQANNTRRNDFITYKGKTKTIAEWAKCKGLKYDMLYSRLKIYGWSIERALET